MNPVRAAVVGLEMSDSKSLARVVGANLAFLRKQRFPGWGGQKRFAEFLGLTPNELCIYEYARCVPNEKRLEDIASKLGLAPEDLLRPLKGVLVPDDVSRLDGGMSTPREKRLERRIGELKEMLAKLEGRCEAIEEQNRNLLAENRDLREANIVLGNLLYFDDSPEARARRDRLLERLGPSMAKLVKDPAAF